MNTHRLNRTPFVLKVDIMNSLYGNLLDKKLYSTIFVRLIVLSTCKLLNDVKCKWSTSALNHFTKWLNHLAEPLTLI